MHCENQYSEIANILKVEINLSFLTLTYLGEFRVKLVSKSKLESFLLKSKENLIIELKPFVVWSVKGFTFFGTPGKCFEE